MRRGSFLGIWEPACGEVGIGGRNVGEVWGSDGSEVSTFRSPAWPERMEVFPMTLPVLPGGPPSPCQPHDQEQVKDYTPAIGGTGQILGDSSRTTLRLCFPGDTGEVSPVSGLPWIHGAFLGVPEGTGARLRGLRSQDMVTETTEWKSMVTDNIWGL